MACQFWHRSRLLSWKFLSHRHPALHMPCLRDGRTVISLTQLVQETPAEAASKSWRRHFVAPCGTNMHQCTAQLTSEAPWNSSYWSYAATYPPAWSAKGTWCSPKQSSEPPVRQAQNWGMVGKLWAALQADYLAILWDVIPSHHASFDIHSNIRSIQASDNSKESCFPFPTATFCC